MRENTTKNRGRQTQEGRVDTPGKTAGQNLTDETEEVKVNAHEKT